jgi:DNA-directed RNA polymerase subunit M/transcription elongation factor TFIIS
MSLDTLFKQKFQHIVKSKKNRENVVQYLKTKLPNNDPQQDTSLFYFLMYEMHVEWSLCPKLDELFSYLKTNNLGLNHVIFDDIKHRLKENDEFISNPPQVEEGVIECQRCKSKRTFSFSKQTRSGDEACTVFVRCAQCNFQFRM